MPSFLDKIKKIKDINFRSIAGSDEEKGKDLLDDVNAYDDVKGKNIGEEMAEREAGQEAADEQSSGSDEGSIESGGSESGGSESGGSESGGGEGSDNSGEKDYAAAGYRGSKGKTAGTEEASGTGPSGRPESGTVSGEAAAQENALASPRMRKGKIKGTSFSIDLRPKVIKLPPFDNPSGIDVRYPVMPPYAYAHISWDSKRKELMYILEEPPLSKVEKNLLRLVQLGLEEMINVSFVRAKKSNMIMQYLEKNVQSILIELGTKVTKETYNKIMYYIYRDSVGLNEIEPLLNDYFIEDIECNGQGYPIYIVHRKYQNLRTNIMFSNIQHLTDFVEKLAQKAGRYVSYAKPILDGTLVDGSRVNATYTSDVTTRGPTFTIRKFTKEPWTPIHLMNMDTASAEVFAFIWIAVENKFNVMVIGETASGKTTFLNSILHFVPPEARICSIEDTRELNIAHDNWLPGVVRSGFGIPNMNGVQYGEITLFELLRETFRQNPDYVVVGEVRGEETYVLFQGMASGHPSFSTFHAASIQTLTRRLETPPINLSPTLVESLDLVCVTSHIKTKDKNVRRLIELDEIIEAKSEVGKINMNKLFTWEPLDDAIIFNGDSHLFKKIKKRTGVSEDELLREMKTRAKLLKKIADNKITDYKRINEITNNYIKDKEAVLKEFGITPPKKSTPDNKPAQKNKKGQTPGSGKGKSPQGSSGKKKTSQGGKGSAGSAGQTGNSGSAGQAGNSGTARAARGEGRHSSFNIGNSGPGRNMTGNKRRGNSAAGEARKDAGKKNRKKQK
ncbi:MAG: ATPase, T2SS/T4P/T4SS family [Candidatus Woesearchaeota archaeon]